MSGYLAKKGRRVLANGYNPIPIQQYDKAPSVKGWQNVETTVKTLNGWLANGKAEDGLGIPTRWTPLVDIDVLDKDGAEHMTNFVLLRHNFPPIRIGQWPKRGILFRSEFPFRKLSSRWYIDDNGRECHVEILGDGQQFVAYHIHPVTKKPYRWPNGDGPDTTPRDDLEILTHENAEAIIAEFHRYAETRGWKPKTGGGQLAVRNNVSDELDPGTDPLGLSEDELRELVRKIPNTDAPYEGEGLTWLNIMAAVHHETDGSEAGEEIAYEWSDRSGKHTNERFEKTWNSFGKTLRVPVTARLLVKLAKEADNTKRKAEIAELMQRMDFARDIDELKAVAGEFRKIDLDLLDRSRVISAFQKAVKAVTNATMSIREARELIKYRPEAGETPEWLEDWCYLRHSAQFYHRKSGEFLGKEAFDGAYSRFAGPETSASFYALNTIKIPTYHMTIYLPGFDETFTDEMGLIWINTYNATSLPRLPDSLNRRDLRNVERAEAHYWHLFEQDREIELFISQLAYIVQTGRRVKWASLLQGGEKIGKTWFAHLAAAVLGRRNVYMLGPDALQSVFNEWVEGRQLIFIEELRMHGANRYESTDRMKPLISNDWIECHKKNISRYNIPNTATFMAATNHRDALPLTNNDTRYFVLMSRWQSTESINEFMASNPEYYPNLWRAILDSPGAIRQWLLQYKLHQDFDPNARAPFSHGHERMVEEGKSDEQNIVSDIIEDGKNPLVSTDILAVHIMKEVVADEMGQIPGMLNTSRGVKNILSSLGFTPLPRVQIDGIRYYTWSRNQSLISADATTVAGAIRRRIAGDL